MRLRCLLYPAAAAALAACSTSSPAATGAVDWGSLPALQGTYHAVTIQKGGRRSEVKGAVSLSYSRSFPVHPGQLEYVFKGTADATVRNSGPAPTDPCAAMGPPVNITGHEPGTGFELHIDSATGKYDWDAEPIRLTFEVGGYTPQCGSPDGSKHMSHADAGQVAVGNLPLPAGGATLCGRTVFSDRGEFTAYVDWIFYPPTAKPGTTVDACPPVKKATGGTS